MIPRTKVNYRIPDLIRTSLINESTDERRRLLTDRLAELFGTSNILLTASGRGALYILLSCLPQSRVLIPAYTCKAVVEAAQLANKEVLFGDSEVDGFNMSVNSLKSLLNANTILLATHQYGIPCDIHSMTHLAEEAESFVIEDAAASFGSRLEGRLTGTFGDAAFFSFDSTKLINVPLKGGFLLVQDPVVFARCKYFHDTMTAPMPLIRKLHYLLLGFILVMLEQPHLYRLFHNLKFHWRGRFTDDSDKIDPHLGPFYIDRLAEWQAALLLPQIDQLDALVAKRRQIYATYLNRLQGVKTFTLPPPDTNGEWAPIRFPIRLHREKLDFYRKAVQRGVDFAFSFTFIASPPEFSYSHKLAASVLNLPFFQRISEKEVDHVVSTLLELDKLIEKGA